MVGRMEVTHVLNVACGLLLEQPCCMLYYNMI